jgi:ribosomal protein S8
VLKREGYIEGYDGTAVPHARGHATAKQRESRVKLKYGPMART